jgi:hypothetical protein
MTGGIGMSQLSTQPETTVVLPLRSSRRKPPEVFASGAKAWHEAAHIRHDFAVAGDFAVLRQNACMRVNPCGGVGSAEIGK